MEFHNETLRLSMSEQCSQLAFIHLPSVVSEVYPFAIGSVRNSKKGENVITFKV